MIGKIKGKLTEVDGNIALVETSSGVSYELYLTTSTLAKSKLNSSLEVYTFLQIRDDAHVLFGFETKSEYKLFKMLISVPGVGPRTAFGVVSYSREEDLITAVKANDIAYFERVPGLGKKTAMKILLELSQKMDSEFELKKMYLSDDDKTVIEALTTLGFKSADAKKTLTKLPQKLTVEEKIREGLKLMGKTSNS